MAKVLKLTTLPFGTAEVFHISRRIRIVEIDWIFFTADVASFLVALNLKPSTLILIIVYHGHGRGEPKKVPVLAVLIFLQAQELIKKPCQWRT